MTRDPTVRWLSSTFVLALSVGILLAPPAAGSTSRPVAGLPATDSLPDAWAFAGAQVVSQSTTQGATTLSQSGQYAWTDLLREGSTGPFSAELVVVRGMVTNYDYRICTPSCSAPSYALHATMIGRAWSVESLNVSLRATTAGGVAAVGVVNASLVTSSSFNATSAVTGSAASAATATLVASAASRFSLVFPSPVALLPIGALGGNQWSSAGSASATGEWSSAVTTTYGGVGTPDTRVSHQQNLTPSEPVAFAATVGPALRLQTGETTIPQTVRATGDLGLVDGVLFEPVGASLFPPMASDTSSPGIVIANGSIVDFDASATGHLGIAGSSEVFQPRLSAPLGATAAPAAADVRLFEPMGWTVQAQPESPTAAQAFFLSQGFDVSSIPLTGTSIGPSPTSVVSWGIVLVAAGLVGVVVAVGARWVVPEWREVAPTETAPARPASARLPSASARPRPPAEPPSAAPSVTRDPFDDLL